MNEWTNEWMNKLNERMNEPKSIDRYQPTKRTNRRERYKHQILKLIDCIWLTSIFLSKIGSAKFGVFLVSSITGDEIIVPMHSNSIEGDVTLDSWNFFMFLTPQQRT